jgi:hypothetical protein
MLSRWSDSVGRHDGLQQRVQISGDGDFMKRMLNLAFFHLRCFRFRLFALRCAASRNADL